MSAYKAKNIMVTTGVKVESQEKKPVAEAIVSQACD